MHTTTIVEKCTLKLVDEYKHMLTQATEPMSTFLEYITYEDLSLRQFISAFLVDTWIYTLIQMFEFHIL